MSNRQKLRELARTGPIKMRAAYTQPAEVPFSADTVRAAMQQLRENNRNRNPGRMPTLYGAGTTWEWNTKEQRWTPTT